VRQELAVAARPHRVEWSFEIVRHAADAPLVATTERNLVVASPLTVICPSQLAGEQEFA
jgi:hypothetical protein